MNKSAGSKDFQTNLRYFIKEQENYADEYKKLNRRYYELKAQILEKAEAVKDYICKQAFCEEIV